MISGICIVVVGPDLRLGDARKLPFTKISVKTRLPAIHPHDRSFASKPFEGPMLPKLILTLIPLLLWMPAQPTIADPSSNLVSDETIDYRLPQGSTPRAIYTRSVACYVFDAIRGTYHPGCAANLGGAINITKLPPAILDSLKDLTSDGVNEISLDVIRPWWNTWAYQLRDIRGGDRLIPETLSDFLRLTNFKSWPKIILKKSHVKNKTRVIYRSNDRSQSLSVSETLESTTGDLEALVLETEVVLERKDGSGNHDFFVYDIHGNLANNAQFPAGDRPAPSTCMSCHYSSKSGKFERVGR
jgi:hypothetical protein